MWGITYDFRVQHRYLSIDHNSFTDLSFPLFEKLNLFSCTVVDVTIDQILKFCREQSPKEIHFKVKDEQHLITKIFEYVEDEPRLQRIRFSQHITKMRQMSKKCKRNRRAFRGARNAVMYVLMARKKPGNQLSVLVKDVALIVAHFVWESRLDSYDW